MWALTPPQILEERGKGEDEQPRAWRWWDFVRASGLRQFLSVELMVCRRDDGLSTADTVRNGGPDEQEDDPDYKP